jgi:hypothetical protein
VTRNITVNGGGSDFAAQVQQAMRRTTNDMIEQLRKAEAADFRLAII